MQRAKEALRGHLAALSYVCFVLGKELTQFGEVFLKQVRQSLEILDGSVDYLHRIAAGNGVVRLGLLRALGVEYQQQDQGQRR